MPPRSIACLLLLVGLTHSPFAATQAQPQATPTPEKTNEPLRTMKGDVEILSDTQGVNFGPYLQRALYRIKTNWYNLIPSVARPPVMKSGIAVIQFAILKSGGVASMVLQKPSGDRLLDQAAWGGITASDPFDRLPPEFSGAYLALRIKFVYNQKGTEETITLPSSQKPFDPFHVPFGFHGEDYRPALSAKQDVAQEAATAPPAPEPKKTPSPFSVPTTGIPDSQGSIPGESSFGGAEVLERGNLSDYDLRQFLEQRLMPTIRRHWYPLIPEKARKLTTRQTAVVSFSIQKDGSFSSVKLDQPTGDSALDKAALEGVQTSAPVALPEKFSGDHMRLRFKFVYEKEKKKLFR